MDGGQQPLPNSDLLEPDSDGIFFVSECLRPRVSAGLKIRRSGAKISSPPPFERKFSTPSVPKRKGRTRSSLTEMLSPSDLKDCSILEFEPERQGRVSRSSTKSSVFEEESTWVKPINNSVSETSRDFGYDSVYSITSSSFGVEDASPIPFETSSPTCVSDRLPMSPFPLETSSPVPIRKRSRQLLRSISDNNLDILCNSGPESNGVVSCKKAIPESSLYFRSRSMTCLKTVMSGSMRILPTSFKCSPRSSDGDYGSPKTASYLKSFGSMELLTADAIDEIAEFSLLYDDDSLNSSSSHTNSDLSETCLNNEIRNDDSGEDDSMKVHISGATCRPKSTYFLALPSPTESFESVSAADAALGSQAPPTVPKRTSSLFSAKDRIPDKELIYQAKRLSSMLGIIQEPSTQSTTFGAVKKTVGKILKTRKLSVPVNLRPASGFS